MSSRSNKSATCVMPEAAPTHITRLLSSGLPIQLNLLGSKRTLGRPMTAASVMLRDTIPITVPSFGATL
jgi:hypothetical protein